MSFVKRMNTLLEAYGLKSDRTEILQKDMEDVLLNIWKDATKEKIVQRYLYRFKEDNQEEVMEVVDQKRLWSLVGQGQEINPKITAFIEVLGLGVRFHFMRGQYTFGSLITVTEVEKISYRREKVEALLEKIMDEEEFKQFKLIGLFNPEKASDLFVKRIHLEITSEIPALVRETNFTDFTEKMTALIEEEYERLVTR